MHTAPVRRVLGLAVDTARRDSPLRRQQRRRSGRDGSTLPGPLREETGQRNGRRTGENIIGRRLILLLFFPVARSDQRPNESSQARMQVPALRWSVGI